VGVLVCKEFWIIPLCFSELNDANCIVVWVIHAQELNDVLDFVAMLRLRQNLRLSILFHSLHPGAPVAVGILLQESEHPLLASRVHYIAAAAAAGLTCHGRTIEPTFELAVLAQIKIFAALVDDVRTVLTVRKNLRYEQGMILGVLTDENRPSLK
jgi:hypothetical protein